MATFRRAVTPGATYFFTVNTYRRQALLTDPPVVSALREALRAVKRAHRFTIDAFVLLPDHLHCLWRLPEGDADYALQPATGIWDMATPLVGTPDTRRP
ncbi:MAG: REP-associated tyrosine transposase [Gammaproteobacteria bacterium]